ncbi:MAG: nodulation protein NfeD [Pseudomonadota bacterium]
MLLVAILAIVSCPAQSSPAQSPAVQSAPVPLTSGEAIVLRLEGAIGPAAASYISDGLQEAAQTDAELVIIKMDTPGGLDTSMREIIRAILASPVPIATYVHPSGGRAASAGTYILYASHFAAMTPGTNLGAATPVQIGAAPTPDAGEPEEEEGGESVPATAMDRKAVNDAAAYIRSLAEMRGRDADWAEEAVRGAASLSANAALERGVIDVVAADLNSLLEQLDGRSVTIDGNTLQIDTSALTIREIEPDWLEQILATITNPNIALILLMIGVYGLIFEFLNPGALVPGTVGAISLLIGMYALAVLPVDYVGVALIVLGIGLMVAEAFAPSFGALGIGGVAAFVFGAAMLFDTDVPAFQVDWSVIAAIGVFSAGFVILVVRLGLKSFRHRVVSGAEELIGAKATVLDWRDGHGHVFVHAERWNAQGPEQLSEGDTVIVDDMTGLKLAVSLSDKANS